MPKSVSMKLFIGSTRLLIKLYIIYNRDINWVLVWTIKFRNRSFLKTESQSTTPYKL